MDNQLELTGNWINTKERLKKRFALLFPRERMLNEEMNEALITRLQGRLGKSRIEIQSIISDLIN